MRETGIITWHYYSNFGSVLQSYALQEAIAELGYEAEFVNYRNLKFGKPNQAKNAVKLFLHYTLGCLFERFRIYPQAFSHKYLRQGKLVTDEQLLQALSRRYSTIICGSDQIWAPNCYNPVYFAAFAGSRTRKVSYAASIGLNDIPAELVPKYKEHLEDFHAVSVRETEGKDLLKEKCGIDATVVLDPTLLHDAPFYQAIEQRVKGISSGKYLFCYFLNKEHNYRERAERYAKEHGLQIVGVSDRKDDATWMTRLTNLSAGHFIWLIHHAETVMTDSYHGTIFSLLFHKEVWTFVRFAEDSPICQNSRIRQLQDYFGENIQVLGQNDEASKDRSIDFNLFESRLKELRLQSLSFLKKALQ